MSRYAPQILGYLRSENSAIFESDFPRWLAKSRWRPALFLRIKGHRPVLAIDIIPSGVIPRSQFRKEVARLLHEHRYLRAVVCVLEEGFEENLDIRQFCEELGIGLKILIPGIGLETVVRTDLDPTVSTVSVPTEPGWFPERILEQASGLDRLVFSDMIDGFVEKVRLLGEEEQQVRNLVFSTIDGLLQQHPSFSQNFGQFMRLDRFEKLLKIVGIDSSEHVFHSFRVFLAGCPVINQFYEVFCAANSRFSIGRSKMCVEYSWLLSSVFHDIGRPSESAPDLLRKQLQDEYVEIRSRPERWQEEKYQTALRILGSLAAFVAKSSENESWDGGSVDDEYGKTVYVDWINIFDNLGSHGVISAIEFLADIFEKARAADQRRYRPFVLTHAVPAALSILLHDWRIWKKKAKTWGLYPVNASALPLAALLIYLDTWDDYKRKESGSLIYVKDYKVNSKGAEVVVEWGDSELLGNERKKYREYEKALVQSPFPLIIKVGMVAEK